jgi:hypothetical protein
MLFAGLCLAAFVFMETAVSGDEITTRARNLHFSSIVVDTHADTTQRLIDGDFDLGPRNSKGSIRA